MLWTWHFLEVRHNIPPLFFSLRCNRFQFTASPFIAVCVCEQKLSRKLCSFTVESTDEALIALLVCCREDFSSVLVFPCSLVLFSFSTNIGMWASSAFSALICEEQHKSIQVQQHTMMMVRSGTRGRLWIIYVRLKTLCFERRKVLPFINLI